MLHNVGEKEKVKYDNEVSTDMTTKNDDVRCHANGLIFTQPDTDSLMDQLSTSSETVGIHNTWIMLDSQSTIDVFCNGELLSQIHKTNVVLGI